MYKFALFTLATLCLLTLTHTPAAADNTDDQPQYFVSGVAFYNVENLFDTINQNGRYDAEYTPEGRRMWDSQRYNNKLDQLASSIAAMATPETPDGPGIIGLAEVENESVVRDLAARIDSVLLAQNQPPRGLKYIHHDSPDPRGIDVALLYNPAYFEVDYINNHALTLPDEPDFRTRDQLAVTGRLLGCPFSVVVGHWPSRLGGQNESEYRRIAAGQLSRLIVDSLRTVNSEMTVVVMGDFNDDPRDKSVINGLHAIPERESVTAADLFNPFAMFHDKGVGTLCYNGNWNLFDQIIISGNAVKDSVDDNLTYWKATVHNSPMLRTKSGKFRNYPLRTFSGNNYLNGYSDHFPTEVFFLVRL